MVDTPCAAADGLRRARSVFITVCMLKPERSLTCVSAEDLAAPETLNLMASIERAAGGAGAGFALLPALDPLTILKGTSVNIACVGELTGDGAFALADDPEETR